MNWWTRQQFNEWRQAASTQRRKHLILAKLWLGFGVHGALRTFHVYDFGPDVAQSVAVLFFISTYANSEGHKTESGTYRVEEKQEEAIESAHSDD